MEQPLLVSRLKKIVSTIDCFASFELILLPFFSAAVLLMVHFVLFPARTEDKDPRRRAVLSARVMLFDW